MHSFKMSEITLQWMSSQAVCPEHCNSLLKTNIDTVIRRQKMVMFYLG